MYTIKVIISQQADYVKIYIMMSQYLSEGYKSHAIKIRIRYGRIYK